MPLASTAAMLAVRVTYTVSSCRRSQTLTSVCLVSFLAANMFVVPLGMMLGADITTNEFIVKNLIPATIGNLIGGGFFVAMWMGMSYGSWEKAITSSVSSLWSRNVDKALPRCNGDGSGCHRNVHSPEMATVSELPMTASVRPHPQV